MRSLRVARAHRAFEIVVGGYPLPHAAPLTSGYFANPMNPGPPTLESRFFPPSNGPMPTSKLHLYYPNPFNTSTTLGYKLDRPANVKLVVYDITGRAVKTLVNQYQFQGQYNIRWESTDEAGLPVPSGTYVIRLQADDGIATKKMILTK